MTLLAGSLATFITGCAQNDQRIEAAAELGAAIKAARKLPAYPDYCRKNFRSGVKRRDRLDSAVLKYDQALSQEHQQTDTCARWYDNLRAGFSEETPAQGPQ